MAASTATFINLNEIKKDIFFLYVPGGGISRECYGGRYIDL
jgi:hypothetical protein